MKKIQWLAIVMGVAMVGCDNPPATPDAGNDAHVGTDGGGSDGGRDAGVDAHVVVDAGIDAHVVPDAGSDAFVEPDAYVPLPAITTPAPHATPVSAAGHDRFYAAVFADDSSFYAVGVTAAGVAATDDYSTVVAHFGANGELDTAFGEGGFFVHNVAVGTNGEQPRGIALQSDGSIVVAETVEHVGTGADPRDRDGAVIRVTTAGDLDDTFGDEGVAILDLSTGEVDGTSFSQVDSAWGIAVDATDRLVVSGSRKRDGALDSDWAVVRLTADGELDTTFAGDGVFSLDLGMVNASARGVSILADGSIVASGYYSPAVSSVHPVIFKLDTTGALVPAFAGDGIYDEIVLALQTEVYGVGIQGDSLVTAGYGRETGMQNDFVSIRVNATTGVRDLTYGGVGYALLAGYDFGDNARGVATLPDGRVILHGQLRADATNQNAAVVIFDEDGALDTTFDTDGVATHDFGGLTDHWWGAAVDPRGERVVVVGIASYAAAVPAVDDDGAIWLFEAP